MATITSTVLETETISNARRRARQEGQLEKKILKYIEEYKQVVEAANTEQVAESERVKCHVAADIMAYTLEAFYKSGVWLPSFREEIENGKG